MRTNTAIPHASEQKTRPVRRQRKVDPPTFASPRSLESDIAALQAEGRWIKSHYEGHLDAALQEIKRLKIDAGDLTPIPEGDLELEVTTLRQEVKRLSEGERRYLDRIEELKQQVANLKAATSKLKTMAKARP